MDLITIRKEMVQGDCGTIARATGLSYSYVTKVLCGTRGLSSDNAKKVLFAAKRIISQRKKLAQELNTS